MGCTISLSVNTARRALTDYLTHNGFPLPLPVVLA